jgi:hypothetical protein
MSISIQLEKSSSRVLALLTDLDGVTPLTNLTSVLATLKLTLTEQKSGSVINSRSAQDVKNANGFTLHDAVQTDPATGTTYNVSGFLDPADNAITQTSAAMEVHVLLFEWTWGTPTRTGRGDASYAVRNLRTVA